MGGCFAPPISHTQHRLHCPPPARFFVLDSQGMLYYYSTKEGSRGSQAPRNTCSLLTATIKPHAEASSRGVLCFRL